jgi:hypothetical protein
MAKAPRSKHVINLNAEQIETLINEAVLYHPFYSPERAQILATLFSDFFLPCADIHPKKDTLSTEPSLNIIDKQPALIKYFTEFNNMIVRISSHKRNFITLGSPSMIEAIMKSSPIDTLTFGDSFIVPEELCEPGCYVMLNVLYEEYLFNVGFHPDKTEALRGVIGAYLSCAEMWKWIPKTIEPFYGYIDPLTPQEVFIRLGYSQDVVKEIILAIEQYRTPKDKNEGDFSP